MKPKLLKIHPNLVESFTARRDLSPAVNNIWHYHEEIELIYICKGEGIRFVGENISRFRSGEIFILGSNLPHYWRFDQEYFEENGKVPDVYVIHFNKNFLGEKFINLPENITLKKLFNQTDVGLSIRSKHHKQLIQLIIQIVENEEKLRLINFLNLIYNIANDSICKPITSSTFKKEFDKKEQERMQDIYNYTFLKFKQKISLEDIASIAKLSPNSFCKFFKSNTKKAILNESCKHFTNHWEHASRKTEPHFWRQP